MRSDPTLSPPSRVPRGILAARQMALRAIMDGRGVDSVILSSPASLRHYGAAGAGLLVVTARAARLLPPGGAGVEGAPQLPWSHAAQLLRRGCALGYEGGWIDAGALALLQAQLAPARLLDLGPEIGRQIALGAGTL